MKDLTVILISLYLFASLLAMVMGCTDVQLSYSQPCKHPIRLQKLLPAYRLGCWLGEPI